MITQKCVREMLKQVETLGWGIEKFKNDKEGTEQLELDKRIHILTAKG